MRAPIDNGTVLITGASSGIGRCLAVQIAPRCKALVLVARRGERLEELAAELREKHSALTVLVQSCDICDFAAVDGVLETIEKEVGPLDVLINNAGMGNFGLFEKSSWERVQAMIQVNVTALTYLTRKVLPGMVERKKGGVLNISSGFGMSVLPGVSTYAATKHYVTAFTEVLRMELASTSVLVSQACPGPIATEFEAVAENKTGLEAPKFAYMTPEKCARLILRGFSRGRAIIYPGLSIRFLLFLNSLTPRWVLRLFYSPGAKLLRKNQS